MGTHFVIDLMMTINGLPTDRPIKVSVEALQSHNIKITFNIRKLILNSNFLSNFD